MAEYSQQMQKENLENLLDIVADKLIQSQYVNPAIVQDSQKFILDGQLQTGAGEGVLALFQQDIKANQEDLQVQLTDEETGETISELQNIANTVNFDTIDISINEGTNESVSIELFDGEVYVDGIDITPFLLDSNQGNPLNVSQFVPIEKKTTNIDVNKANEFLDTNIYELLPDGDVRQERINNFFSELNALLPPTSPNFDNNNDGVVDRDENGNWDGAIGYSQDNSISYAQQNDDSNIDEQDAFIHRLKSTVNETNSNTTIEDIYNTILPYLTDILEEPITPQDDRPEYQNQSDGYLQFRNLNQGIIIRNTTGQFIEGLNPETQDYLETGFTITMWVKFLDKSSEGTLFNFGNPTRQGDDVFGFRLETYVLNKNGDNPHTGHETWGDGASYIGQNQYFENSNTARFVRLVIDDNGTLRDSHLGFPNAVKQVDIADMDGDGNDEFRLLQTTFIPEDFNEWYFICASFNPNISEDESYGLTSPTGDPYNNEPLFWLNHINPDDGQFVSNSDFGNRCKVEIISKTDLPRARGFKS